MAQPKQEITIEDFIKMQDFTVSEKATQPTITWPAGHGILIGNGFKFFAFKKMEVKEGVQLSIVGDSELHFTVKEPEQQWQDDYKIGYEHGKQHFLEKYYKGNSIQHWHNKAVAYGNTISELWAVLKSKGFGEDGKTSIVDMLGKALEQECKAIEK
jgi:hypothetical protein